MQRLTLHVLACLCMVSSSVSCGQPSGPKIKKVPVVPVKGSVTVDGKKEAGVIVRCVPIGDFEPKDLANALGALTDEEGEFTLGTYAIDDGVPPAEYALTFLWPQPSLKRQSRADELKHDRLKGKYAKPDQPALKIKVETGKPLELDLLEFTTK